MGKRVAKEINTVVNGFYPTIENHYIEFHDLDNSYQELVSRFATLESAQDYATQLDSTNISFYETGYNLCKRVIDLPRRYASAASSSAIAEGVIGQFSSNKYSRQSAARNSREKMAEANRRLEEISRASKIIEKIRQKYALAIEKTDPNHRFIKELDQEIKNKALAKKEAEKTNYQTYATIIIAGILYFIILPLDLQINSVLLFIMIIVISLILGVKLGGNFYNKK
jgi:hypothetical protein